MTISNPLKWIFTLSILTLSSLSLAAQADNTTLQTPKHREYTEAHPLVYEDVWDLWPYAYLNDNGEPEGYNIDLIRLMMDELDIPYVIRLRPAEEAFHDLKSGRSDLMLGLAVGFHDEYGSYSKHAVTLFTQSVATPKSKPIEIKAFREESFLSASRFAERMASLSGSDLDVVAAEESGEEFVVDHF